MKKLLAGAITSRPGIEGKPAMGALARSEPSAATATVLAGVLADRNASRRDRAAAAANLGRIPADVAEAPLLAALTSTSGMLRLEVIKALGRTGNAGALERLGELDDPGDEIVRGQLAFAKLAIGLGSAGEVPGRDDLHVVLVNEAMVRGDFVSSLITRGLIAGLLVAREEPGLDTFGVRWLLLTQPSKDGLRMVLVRPNGDPAFEGEARLESNGLRFRMRDTGMERIPAEIEGTIASDDISWTIRVWRGCVLGKKHPRSIPF